MKPWLKPHIHKCNHCEKEYIHHQYGCREGWIRTCLECIHKTEAGLAFDCY